MVNGTHIPQKTKLNNQSIILWLEKSNPCAYSLGCKAKDSFLLPTSSHSFRLRSVALERAFIIIIIICILLGAKNEAITVMAYMNFGLYLLWWNDFGGYLRCLLVITTCHVLIIIITIIRIVLSYTSD